MFAESLVAQFERMVARDGGSLSLISASDDVIEVGYRAGSDPTCEGDACILPHMELQELMNETAGRRQPGMRVVVKPIE